MAHTFSDGVTDISPLVLDGYEAVAESRNVVHRIINGPDDVTLVAAGPRSGSLSAVFASKSDAWALRTMLVEPGVLELTSTDVAEVGMSFVLDDDGDPTIRLDDTRVAWIVEFGYREVIL